MMIVWILLALEMVVEFNMSHLEREGSLARRKVLARRDLRCSYIGLG